MPDRMTEQPKVIVFARFPVPGAAKTRLIPALGAQGAAEMHRKLVERTMHTVRRSALPFEVRCTGADLSAFASWLGTGVALVEQGGGDLGDRLARAKPPAILIGCDAPDLTAGHLTMAARALQTRAAVIGPALDGGYWLLGIAKALPTLFGDMAWGTDSVFAETITRMAAAGINPLQIETLADLDRPEDLLRWPDLAA